MLYRIDEDAVTRAIIELASEYGRYGYRRITAKLQARGWPVGKDRVQRIWRREGLKVPQKQRPRGRLWLGDGSCLRLRPERANHVWSYDFVSAMTHDGRTLRMLTLIDEYTRECLAIRVARRLGRYEVIEALADVMLYRGIPENIRSDNGPEFVAEELRKWLAKVGTETLYIEPGSPWENGYCEGFNGKLRDECLNGEIFYSLREAQVVIEKWRVVYNTQRPHSALGYRPPAPAAFAPQMAALRSPTAPCEPPFASVPDEVVSKLSHSPRYKNPGWSAWRPPRPWRSGDEARLIRRYVFQWLTARGKKPSGRDWARQLGISHTWLQKLVRKFQAVPNGMWRLQATKGDPQFSDLTRAGEYSRQMRERRELRLSPSAKRAKFFERY